MNSLQRVLAALDPRDPDRVPYDIGSTQVISISIRAYERLRTHLSLPPGRPQVCDILQALALPSEDLLEQLPVDTRGLYLLCGNNSAVPRGGEAWRRSNTKIEGG
ncbi:MAG: hypothetical protein ACOC8H_02015 [bacterium]